jgi:hypothetical protein
MEGEWSPRCEPTPGLVRPVPIDPAGWSGPTRGQAAGPRWRRTSPGLFVPADVVTDVEQRIVEGAARLGHYGAVSGWAALRWRGAAYFDGHDREGSALPIPLAVGRSCLRPGEGIERLRRQIPLCEWDVHRGLRCALWERALYDEVIRLGTPRASAVAIDMVVAAGLGTIADYWAFLEEVRPRNGVVLSRAAAGLARGTSASPPESWMRLTWCLDAGLPEPLCNAPVFDLHDNLLGVADLFDPVAGVVGEYQGAIHRSRDQHRHDVERAERFRDHGLEYFEVVAGQLNDVRTAYRMRAIRARARFLAPGERSWTLEKPEWWLSRHPTAA